MYIRHHVKYPSLSFHVNRTSIVFADFQKNTQILNFMKIRLEGAELLIADGMTDMTKLMVNFRKFANPPKNAFGVFLIRTSSV